jgi:hypothetical protein
MLLKILFSRRFNDYVQGLFKINSKVPQRFDDFRPQPQAGLNTVYVALWAGHGQNIA